MVSFIQFSMNISKEIAERYLNLLVALLLIATAFFMAFFKPAISIGMGSLFGISIIKWVLFTRPISRNQKLSGYFIALISTYAFLLLWLLVSVSWSEAWMEAVKSALDYNELLLVPVIAYVNRDMVVQYFDKIFFAVVAGCAIASGITLYFVVFPEDIPMGGGYYYFLRELAEYRDFNKFGWYSPFLDRLYFSYLLGAVLLVYWLKAMVSKLKWFYWPLLLFLLPAFWFLGGRGAQLALYLAVLASGIYFVASSKKGGSIWKFKRKIVGAAVGLLIGGPLLFLLLKPSDSFTLRYNQLRWEIDNYKEAGGDFESLQNQTAVLRLVSWEYNLRILRDYPLTGVGVGDYRTSMRDRYRENDVNLAVHSNQQFLFYGVIGGLPALLAFLLFFVGSGVFLFRKGGEKLKSAAIAWWIYMGVVMMFDSPLLYQMPAFLFLIGWFGLFCSGVKSAKSEE